MNTTGSFNNESSGALYNGTATQELGRYDYSIFKWHGAEIVVLILIFISGTVGNSLVLYIYHVRWQNSNFTFFIKILAFVDLFNCVVSVPFFFAMTLVGDSGSFEPLCKTTSFMAMSNTVSSAFVLAIVAYDRNQKIHRPLKHEIKHRTTQRLGALAVILGLGMSVPGILLFGKKKTRYTENGVDFNITWCFLSDEKLGSTLLIVYLSVLGGLFMVILWAMGICYFSIWRTLRVHLQSRESLGCLRSSVAMSKNGSYYRSQKTSAKLFFIVTVAFFASYFPYYISVAVFLLNDYQHHLTSLGKSFADIAKLAPMASCAINPLIYSISSARFRREITQLFTRTGLPQDGNRKVLLNTLYSKDRNPKHSKSHSGSSYGLKVIVNDPVVFNKVNVNKIQKQAYS